MEAPQKAIFVNGMQPLIAANKAWLESEFNREYVNSAYSFKLLNDMNRTYAATPSIVSMVCYATRTYPTHIGCA